MIHVLYFPLKQNGNDSRSVSALSCLQQYGFCKAVKDTLSQVLGESLTLKDSGKISICSAIFNNHLIGQG